MIHSLSQPCRLDTVSLTKLDFIFLRETENALIKERLYPSHHPASRLNLHIELSADMFHLDFSLDCEVFAFSLRVGSKPSEDPPKSLATADINTDDTSNESIQGEQNARSRGFLEIPTEILDVIFQELLEYSKPIHNAHELLGTERVLEFRKPHSPQIKGLQPAILRTCRSIYLQAPPILYGNKTFKFDSGSSLTEFAHEGLDGQFAFQNTRYGRLTMIHCSIIELGGHRIQHDFEYFDKLWTHCNKVLKPDDHRDAVGFPSLLNIALDFSPWELAFGVREINVGLVSDCRPSTEILCDRSMSQP